jgi:molybdopterin-guanine dinucleotide biosynthesis protein A
MPAAGIVLAGGRSSRMGEPKAWLDWHGAPLLRRLCGIVARGARGPVVVVRAPGQELPPLPHGVRVADDAREGRGPLQGILAGLEAVDADVAFVASVDLPFLHPQFVAAVCAAAEGVDAAVPRVGDHAQPLAAAYRPALAPVAAELLEAGDAGAMTLIARVRARVVDQPPHPESVRNLDTRADYEAALGEPEPLVRVRRIGPGVQTASVRAATLGAAAAAVGVQLGAHVLAALNGDTAARDPLEPLAEDDDVAFVAADAAG